MEVIIIKESLVNEAITAKELRVNYDGGSYGVISRQEAIKKAEEAGLDLVLIAPQANPPVAKIMDYGKFRFELLRREKEAKKKQKVNKVKEVQLGLTIAENDMNTKARNAKRFLEDGDKVKVTMRLRGRQIGNPQLGIAFMLKFAELFKDEGEVTSHPILQGFNRINMIISPIKK